jgi:hypothetical protein
LPERRSSAHGGQVVSPKPEDLPKNLVMVGALKNPSHPSSFPQIVLQRLLAWRLPVTAQPRLQLRQLDLMPSLDGSDRDQSIWRV